MHQEQRTGYVIRRVMSVCYATGQGHRGYYKVSIGSYGVQLERYQGAGLMRGR